jgi:hypothetical protein
MYNCILVRLYFPIAMEFRLEGFVVLTFIYFIYWYTWSTSDAMVFAVCLHSSIICSWLLMWSTLLCWSFIFEMDLHCHRLLPYVVNQLVDWSTIYVGTPHSLWFPLHLIEFARQELRYIRVESLCVCICLVCLLAYLSDLSVFQWSTSYWLSVAIVASLLRRHMLNSSAS